jgi:hypothetical protein
MYAHTIRSLLVLLALSFVPAALVAQQRMPQPETAPEPPPQVQVWISEAQQIQQRLEPIHTRAMEDPALRQAQTELSGAIVVALMQAGPEVQADIRRVETIQPELRAAQDSGNQEQLQRLVREAQQLQQRLAQAQSRVMERPEIAAQAEAFQTRLQARMVALEPRAEAMLQRLMALQAQILEAMQEQHPRR